jgi:D-alanyl-D-alanine dipeptidase
MDDRLTQCERCGRFKQCQGGRLKVCIDAYGRCCDFLPVRRKGIRPSFGVSAEFSLVDNRTIEPSYKYGRTCAICRHVSQAARRTDSIVLCMKHGFMTKDAYTCDSFEVITRELYEQQMNTEKIGI